MNDMSLKAKVRNLAAEKKVSAQSVLQSYLLGRFLYRISLTEYQDKLVVKGGMLISSIIGIAQRSTMDLDASLRNLPLTEESISQAILQVCKVETDDGITFLLDNLAPIRDDDEYGGYRVSFHALFGKINAPMSMDVSTGDIITPEAEKRLFRDMFDPDTAFELWSYPVETVLAEKVETILSRGVDNTRPRDYYDVYMLSASDFDSRVFLDAFAATARHRGSFEKILDTASILKTLASDSTMQKRWDAYTRQMPYAAGIGFQETVAAVRKLLEDFEKQPSAD